MRDCRLFLEGRFHIVNCILIYFFNRKMSPNNVMLKITTMKQVMVR